MFYFYHVKESFCSVCDTQKEILHFIEAYGENYCWAPVRHVMLWWHGLAQGSLYERKTSMDQKFSVKRVIIQLHRRFCHNEGKMISELRATEENWVMLSDAAVSRLHIVHPRSSVGHFGLGSPKQVLSTQWREAQTNQTLLFFIRMRITAVRLSSSACGETRYVSSANAKLTLSTFE